MAACAIAALMPALAAQTPGVQLVDVSNAAGIRFQHATGATGRKYLPETLGSGVTVFDADGDGRQDVLFMSGISLPAGRAGAARARRGCSATAAAAPSRTSRRKRA